MFEFVPTSILVTGGAGFIGSHVVRRLHREFPNACLVVLDKLDVCSSVYSLDSHVDRFLQCDLTDGLEEVAAVLEKHSIDTVMHFAAHTHVDLSFGNSLAFTLNNTYGTHVLLEACRSYGRVKRFINVSTDEVYGESLSKVREDSVLEPTNPYAAAKAGAEMMAKAYQQSFGLPIITTRGNNVYGPGQYPEKLVPKMLMRALQKQPLEVHGDGSSLRSFVYIDDAVDAFVIILRHGRVGDVYNIGSLDNEMSVLQVAKQISGMYKVPIRHVRDRAFNDRRYFICDSKLKALDWDQKTSWEEGLKKTAAWYADMPPGYWAAINLSAHSASP
jgi:UDP-glucose 4,6-dehydratase